MDAAHISSLEDRSLARSANRLRIAACVIGLIALAFVPGSQLQGLLHGFGLLMFCYASMTSGTTLRRIAELQDADPAPMWRRSLLSTFAVAVSFLVILGPKAGAVSSVVALGAVAVIITALLAKRVPTDT